MDPRAYTLHAELESRHWWFAGRRAIVESVARGLSLPPDARIVELGSGTGGNLAFLGRLGRVTAIEIDDGARSVAREKAPHAEHLRTIAELGELSGEAFDAAFALDVLEHLDDPVATLRELHAWMAPDAPLIVTVPAQSWLYGAHDRFHHHRRRYDEPELRSHLELGGFVVDALAPMNTLLFPAAVLARVAEALTSFSSRRTPAEGQARGLSMPPRPVNSLLSAIFASERRWLPRRVLPAGVSWLAVARRAN